MAEITTAFQSLSRETIQLSVVIRDHSLPQAAQVLDRIQAVEKVKLTLTAEWQVLVAVEIGDEEFDQAEHTHKQKILRQKYDIMTNTLILILCSERKCSMTLQT